MRAPYLCPVFHLPCHVLPPPVEFIADVFVPFAADQKEFLRLCQAVGMGFLIMGAGGYVVKLIHIPLNNVLVGGA